MGEWYGVLGFDEMKERLRVDSIAEASVARRSFEYMLVGSEPVLVSE